MKLQEMFPIGETTKMKPTEVADKLMNQVKASLKTIDRERCPNTMRAFQNLFNAMTAENEMALSEPVRVKKVEAALAQILEVLSTQR